MVNLAEPAVSYASWFSDRLDVVSQTAELQASAPTTRQVYPHHKRCFVGDSGWDDEKYFSHVLGWNSTFIIRLGQANRWEREKLADLIATMPPFLRLEAPCTPGRPTRTTRLRLGWLKIRLPDWETPRWVLAIHDPPLDQDFGLLTNRPTCNDPHAAWVLTTWRYRPHIEQTYRLSQ